MSILDYIPTIRREQRCIYQHLRQNQLMKTRYQYQILIQPLSSSQNALWFLGGFLHTPFWKRSVSSFQTFCSFSSLCISAPWPLDPFHSIANRLWNPRSHPCSGRISPTPSSRLGPLRRPKTTTPGLRNYIKPLHQYMANYKRLSNS